MRRASVFLAAVLALLVLPSVASSTQAHVPSPAAPVVPEFDAGVPPELAVVRAELDELRARLEDLSHGNDPPAWAGKAYDRMERRLERMATMLEGLSARVETPIPRLDEPLTLLTVSACTLVLGFLAGRSLQRRAGRRDPRFRL